MGGGSGLRSQCVCFSHSASRHHHVPQRHLSPFYVPSQQHVHNTTTAMAPSRAGGAGAAAAQAPSRPRALLVVAFLAFASTVSASSPLLPRPLGLGFVPSSQQRQHQPPSSSSPPSSSCCGGRHHASHTHARPAAATTKRHALPPFDSPLDPATLESMAAAASSAAASTGGALNEVTPEQLWVRMLVCVCVCVCVSAGRE